MIKLKSLLLESIGQEISSFESQLQAKYNEYIEQFHIYYDELNNSIFLSDIYIKEKYKDRGWGTKIMKELCQFADSKKLTIVLIPAPESIHPKAQSRLIRFYRKFGFIENNGNIQFDDMGMYRLPKL